MEHNNHKITSFKITAPYTLELKFNDNKVQIINFKKLLYGEMFSILRDPKMFEKVTIDPEVFTIVWPNGADFDPEILYDWEKYQAEIFERAEKWKMNEEN
ncbi:MAG: DUF2442 domain-containing protein [Ignavibacteria bacterium]